MTGILRQLTMYFRLIVKLVQSGENLLIGIGSESFQIILIHLTTDVAQAKIGDSVVGTLPLQQSSYCQYFRTTASMILTNRNVQTSCPRGTKKRSITVLAVKAEKRTIGGMKPGGGGKHGIIGSGRHTLTILACAIWIFFSRSEIYNTRDRLKTIGTDKSLTHRFSSLRREPPGNQCDRADRANPRGAAPHNACVNRSRLPVQRLTASRRVSRSLAWMV